MQCYVYCITSRSTAHVIPRLFYSNRVKKVKGYWENDLNVQNFLQEVKLKFNLQSITDWNSLTQNQICELGGRGLLRKFSIYEIKCLGCPEGKTKFKLNNKPSGYWNNHENINKFINKLKNEFNFRTKEDWESLTYDKIRLYGGRSLLRKYSIPEIKSMGYLDGEILVTISKEKVNSEYLKKFVDNLKDKLNLQTFEDWNSLTKNVIYQFGGKNLLKTYSMYNIKCLGFPEGQFTKETDKKPKKYWKQTHNVQQFILKLKEKLNLNTFDDWNSLNQKQIIKFGGSGLLRYLSITEIKSLGFPEGNFQLNNTIPSNYFENKENVKKFISEFGENLNLKTASDWDSITHSQISSVKYGPLLLQKYSVYDVKSIGFPSGKFTKHTAKPYKYWANKYNILDFLNIVEKEYDFKTFTDWNSLNQSKIIALGGARLLKLFSIFEIKCMGCPEGIDYFDKPKKPPGYWENRENITNFIDSFKIKYDLKSKDDWNRISKQQIYEQGGRGLLKASQNPEFISKTENIPEISELTSPKQNNQSNSTAKLKRSSQRWLFLQIQKIFPGEEIVEDYFHPEISRKSGFNVQFDVYLTNKKIAFEYHGKQHYEDIPSTFSPLEIYQHRDSEKQNLCGEFGIQLIVIPYWWDNSIESLKETIDYNLLQFS